MIFKSILGVMLVCALGCANDREVGSHLDSIETGRYYNDEVVPTGYEKLYGTWRLYAVSGGFSGAGHKPDFDYLEIKRVGIFGVVRRDSLVGFGKIEVATFDPSADEQMCQIRLVYDTQTEFMHPSEKYAQLSGTDSLNLISPCCDMYNYHFKRVR